MPTGYTAQLEGLGYDVARWVKERIARGMGMLIMLRDDGYKSEAEILKSLRSSGSDYHAKAIADARHRLATFETYTDAQWELRYAADRAEAQRKYEADVVEWEQKRNQHERAKDKAERWLHLAETSNADTAVIGTLRFAVEQLNTAHSSDYADRPTSYLRPKILDESIGDYISMARATAAKDIAYHEKELAASNERDDQRRTAYEKLVAFVDAQAAV